MIHKIYLGPLFDRSAEYSPWSTLAWTQVHHGHLPLWNPYSALGTPLAFNWQSATFSLPTLVGYLAPVQLAYTVSVLCTLVIGGTGVYALGRVLRLEVLACAMAATVFELSGPFMAWLGSPVASVMSWAGWLFAAIILITRGKNRVRHVAFMAIVVACTIYAGQPDTVMLVVAAVLVFLVVLFTLRAFGLGKPGPILLPVGDLFVASIAGFALAAPLALPGLQLARTSIRTSSIRSVSLPVHDALNLVFQGFNGLPWAGSHWFDQNNYFQTAAYVGVVAVVLALVAVVMRRRQPEVIAFAAVALIMISLVFIPAVMSLVGQLPHGRSIQWHRSLLQMCFALAVLAGIGADVLIHSHARRDVLWWTGGSFAGAGVLLAVLWGVGRGDLALGDASIRSESFVWPVLTTVVGLAVVGVLAFLDFGSGRSVRLPGRHGAGSWAVALLLLCETAFLAYAGAPLWSSSPTNTPNSHNAHVLEQTVGSSVVGFGTRSCNSLGIPQEANAALGIREFAAYDPLLPRSYFSSWHAVTKSAAGPTKDSLSPRSEFCPAITSATVARLYGVKFILEPDRRSRSLAPKGGVLDKKIGDEKLYRVPGAASATLSPLGPNGSLPSPDAPGTVVKVLQPDPGTWKLVTDARAPQVLRLRLTGVPGWQATINGKPLRLDQFSGVMLQARVPPGKQTIELTYWPRTFTIGIILALCSAVGLVLALCIARFRRAKPAP
jgi:hypothetical protein